MAFKKIIGALALSLCGAAWAGTITPASISGNGTYSVDGLGLNILADGVVPAEGINWTTQSVSWIGQTGSTGAVFTLDFGQLYTLKDVLVGVDNNDYYQVQISANGSQWNTLFTNLAFEGQSGNGSEIISSIAGDPEYQATIDFAPTQARYARIYAVGGDNMYSVSELSFSGVAVVPEPETYAMLLAGLGIMGAIARSKKKTA